MQTTVVEILVMPRRSVKEKRLWPVCRRVAIALVQFFLSSLCTTDSRKRRQVSSSRAGTSPKQSRSTAKSKRLATTDDDDEVDLAPKKRTRTSKPSGRTERVTRVKSSKGRPKISAGGPRRHSRRNVS